MCDSRVTIAVTFQSPSQSLGRNVSLSRSAMWFQRDVFNQSDGRAERDEDIDLRNALSHLSGARNASNQLTNGTHSPKQQDMDSGMYTAYIL